MAERHRVPKGPEPCDASGCKNPAERSLAGKKVRKALPSLGVPDEARRARLCKDHYKQFRKATKEERELDRLGW